MEWQWKRDLRKGDTADDAWEDYDEADSKTIEAGFKAKKKTIKLNNKYTINYAESIQYRTGDKNRQREIRRVKKKSAPKKVTPKRKKAPAKKSGKTAKKAKGSPLNGKKISFTGTLQTMKRAEAQKKAEAAGATFSKTVTKDTDILVAASGAGSKIYDAKAKGIEVWDEDEFVAALDGGAAKNEKKPNEKKPTLPPVFVEGTVESTWTPRVGCVYTLQHLPADTCCDGDRDSIEGWPSFTSKRIKEGGDDDDEDDEDEDDEELEDPKYYILGAVWNKSELVGVWVEEDGDGHIIFLGREGYAHVQDLNDVTEQLADSICPEWADILDDGSGTDREAVLGEAFLKAETCLLGK
eukprot:m.275785 g.275785  ORF g.275785 m.275785 type:complete len:352 (-) comp16295_c0_seq2:134-1189(-)